MKYLKKYNEEIDWDFHEEEDDPNPIFNFKIGDFVIIKEPVYFWNDGKWEKVLLANRIRNINGEIVDIKRTIDMTDDDYEWDEYFNASKNKIETDEWVVKIQTHWPWFRTNNMQKFN